MSARQEENPFKIYDARWNARYASDPEVREEAERILKNSEKPLDLLNATFSELDALRLRCVVEADHATLELVVAEARARDGWDDTDVSLPQFIEACESDLRALTASFGQEN